MRHILTKKIASSPFPRAIERGVIIVSYTEREEYRRAGHEG
jgi:hypothetical protein